MDKDAQSTSICIPCKCTHSCQYCVSFLTCALDNKTNKFLMNHQRNVKDSLEYASNKSNILIITARHGEPTANMLYIKELCEMNDKFSDRFIRKEVQTNGSLLLEHSMVDGKTNVELLADLGIKTISLSLSSVFSSDENAEYNRPHKPVYKTDIDTVCKAVKDAGLMLRLSLNMTDFYDTRTPEEIFQRINDLGADQVTFRILYNVENPVSTPEIKIYNFIKNHNVSPSIIKAINAYIIEKGELIGVLPFGALQYYVAGISCVVDDNCMDSQIASIEDDTQKVEALKAQEQLRYFIIETNGELYPNWNKKGRIM